MLPLGQHHAGVARRLLEPGSLRHGPVLWVRACAARPEHGPDFWLDTPSTGVLCHAHDVS